MRLRRIGGSQPSEKELTKTLHAELKVHRMVRLERIGECIYQILIHAEIRYRFSLSLCSDFAETRLDSLKQSQNWERSDQPKISALATRELVLLD